MQRNNNSFQPNDQAATMGKFIEARAQLLTTSSGTTSTSTSNNQVEGQQNKTKAPPKRRVTFEEEEKHVHFGLSNNVLVHRDDDDLFSDITQMWYTRSELIKIAGDSTVMIKKEKKFLKANNEDQRGQLRREDKIGWTWRGFEYALHKYGKFRLRKQHCAKVLKFQRSGRCDPMALASLAHNDSSGNGSILRARSLAVNDQVEAARIHKDSTSIMRKSRTLPRNFKQNA
ncbi:expressed unknown protein [Seminavis robusta]|uniref:Uncharacterized protein n=1 Tax=Seminavis robusta TaxID=568900 RepID=A0A9N8EMG9_9STRA|nr:expressed unknown protein [Seminavis robusta]|eukprot:Sro1261_g257060.1 n/a (229) ;mRNA; r:24769-25455